MKEKKDIVKKIIKDLLSRLTVDAEVNVTETIDGIKFVIETPEGGLLIGENGKNLISLNHIIKKIAGKQIDTKEGDDFFPFSLDVNDYQAKKIEDLKNIARVNVQRVRYFKKEIVLKPMTSFERRVVHMALADCPDIVTDSRGEEPQRCVVLKPYL